MSNTNFRQPKQPCSTTSAVQRKPTTTTAIGMVASREPAEKSWTKSNTGQGISANRPSTGSTGWREQERVPSHRQSQRGCSQKVISVPHSSAHETLRTGATSTSSSPLWPSNSHGGTPNFDQSSFPSSSQIQESPTSPCTTR